MEVLTSRGSGVCRVWKQPLAAPLVRTQPDSPTRPLVVNGSCCLLQKFGKTSAPSGVMHMEVLRCHASNSLREGLRPRAQTRSTQTNHSRTFNIRAAVLGNTISVLQQLVCSRSLGSQNPAQTAARTPAPAIEPPPPRDSVTKKPQPSTFH